MEFVKWIDYKGKKILLSDLAKTGPADWPEIDSQYEENMKGMPDDSVLALVCVEDAHFDSETIKKFKERAKKDAPYIKKTAVVGITGIKKVVYSSIMRFAGRDGKVFDDREQAKEWLLE